MITLSVDRIMPSATGDRDGSARYAPHPILLSPAEQDGSASSIAFRRVPALQAGRVFFATATQAFGLGSRVVPRWGTSNPHAFSPRHAHPASRSIRPRSNRLRSNRLRRVQRTTDHGRLDHPA